MENKFYDINRLLTYNAKINLIVGGRNIGKTFSVRKHLIEDFLKNNKCFCNFSRYNTQKKAVSTGFFEKLQQEGYFLDYKFKQNKNECFISPNKKKENWERIGYFVALSSEPKIKEQTFSNCYNLVFDEAIIDQKNKAFYRYINNEWVTLANCVSSVTRELPNQEKTTRLFLMANAVDWNNPYFQHFKIPTDIKHGTHWLNPSKTAILDFLPTQEISREINNNTLFGIMLENDQQEVNKMINNDFIMPSNEFLEQKPKKSSFIFGIAWNGSNYGIWDGLNDNYYISTKIPQNTSKNIYALTLEDFTINYKLLKKCSRELAILSDLYANARLRFENLEQVVNFEQMLRNLGYNNKW